MRLQASKIIAGSVLTVILFAVSTFASSHKALNGTWVLIPAKSDFAGQPVIQTGTVTIDDRQGNITISRNFTYDGATDTLSYSFSTDGRENSTIQSGKEFKSKAKWEGDVLKVTTTLDGRATVERYRLGPDGTLMLNLERPELKPVTLVFQHQ